MTAGDSGGSTVRGGPDGCIDIECSLTGSPYDVGFRRYGSTMTAMTLETAKNIGIAVAVGLIALMLLMAFVVKNVTVKLISILVDRRIRVRCVDAALVAAGLRRQGARRRRRRHQTSRCSFLGSDVKVSALPVP